MKKRAFSLMELIIVIVIVGILIGAMIPMFTNNTDKSRRAKAQSECEAIKTAVLMYHADTGEWPAGPKYTNGNDMGYGLIINNWNLPNWNGPYLDKWLLDPWSTSTMVIRYMIRECNGGLVVCARTPSSDCCVDNGDGVVLTITPVFP